MQQLVSITQRILNLSLVERYILWWVQYVIFPLKQYFGKQNKIFLSIYQIIYYICLLHWCMTSVSGTKQGLHTLIFLQLHMKETHVSSNLCHQVILLMAKSVSCGHTNIIFWKDSSIHFSLFHLKICYTLPEILSFLHTSCYFKISGSPAQFNIDVRFTA